MVRSVTELAAGGCLCGDVRYEVSGEPTVCCLCHCTLCRRSVGATPVAWATYPSGALRVVRGAPTWFESSAWARRGFCARCGTSLFFASTRHPDEIDVTSVSLDDADGVAPDRHIWVPSKLAWVGVADGRPCHVADSGSELVPEPAG